MANLELLSDLSPDPDAEPERKAKRQWKPGRKKRRKRDRKVQPRFFAGKVLVWFSCGASSAVALKLAVEEYGLNNVVAYYNDTSSDEHPDNLRFLADVERWTGATIHRIKSEEFEDCIDVYEKTGFVVSPEGARCTLELKRKVGNRERKIEDVNIYGFTADKREVERADSYFQNNFDQQLDFILIRHGVTKADCFEILKAAGIRPSAMYELGFNNANCRGCVKVRSLNYWLKVRHYWPERYARLAEVTRKLGVALIRFQRNKETVWLFLDEVPAEWTPDFGDRTGEEGIDCGVLCSGQALEVAPGTPSAITVRSLPVVP